MSGSIANLHVVFAVLSLAFGLRIFTTRRGTPAHRKLGYGYIGRGRVRHALPTRNTWGNGRQRDTRRNQ